MRVRAELGVAPMPTLVEMRLKASWTVLPDTRRLHGLASTLFESEAADHEGQHTPFAVWPLYPGQSPDEWEWRGAWLPDSALPSRAATAETLRMGNVNFLVTEKRQHRVPHAGLASGPPLRAATVTFGSPTYFSQNGVDAVIPDPRLIVGSWWRRWNMSLPGGHPLAISDEEWTAMSQILTLAAFDLRTESRDTGYGRDRAGFTGSAILRLTRKVPLAARKIFGALARFSEYCGTGAQTAHGFGATSVSAANG